MIYTTIHPKIMRPVQREILLCKIFNWLYNSIVGSTVEYRKIMIIGVLAILIGNPLQCIASTTDSIKVATVYFKQGSSKVEVSLDTNAANLSAALPILRATNVSHIIVVGSASPEGTQQLNKRLSRERAAALVDYLSKYLATPDSIEIISVGENWSLLRTFVLKDTNMLYRKDILNIIDSNQDDASKQKRIAALDGGKVMQKLMSDIYPKLRQAVLYTFKPKSSSGQDTITDQTVNRTDNQIIDHTVHPTDTTSKEMQSAIPVTETIATTEFAKYEHIPCPDRRFAVKTNTLYWLALTPNIEAEWFIAPQWSVNGEFQYGWWANDHRHHYWRIAAGGAEMRYWLSRDKGYFNGHFIGAYLSGGIYEFMFRPELGVQGEVYVSGGLTYGYTLPLGCRFAMEFSLGVGYLNTLYREYHWNGKCYQYDQSNRLNYLGLTKAKVSFIWRIGKGGIKR